MCTTENKVICFLKAIMKMTMVKAYNAQATHSWKTGLIIFLVFLRSIVYDVFTM